MSRYKLVEVPAWPKGVPCVFTDRAKLVPGPWDHLSPLHRLDAYATYMAKRRRAIEDAVQCTGLTATYNEQFFTATADHTALASSAAEGSLLAGTNRQPVIPAGYFLQQGGVGRGIEIFANGIFSNTGTPTLIFQVRLGETAGSSYLSGTSVGVSAAITTANGVSNKYWELRLRLTCRTPGIGTGNTTLSGAGYVMSMSGFGTPFFYPLEPTTPDTATWTSTINAAVTQYLNLSATWSASSASNTITCKDLQVTAYG